MDSQYHDTILVNNDESYPRHSLSLNHTKELVDLHSATYFSDGNTLNSTLWLTKRWIQNHSSDHTILFGILIDVDNNRSTGFNYLPNRGFEYVVQLNLNNGNWSKEVDEFTTAGRIRNLVYENYPKDPLESFGNSIPLSLDLSMLNYPTVYGLEFFVTDIFIDNQGRQISYTDTVGPVHVKSLSRELDQGTPLTSTSSSQEIEDPNQDGIQINLRNYSNIKQGTEFPLDKSVDIESVRYLTDRKVLSATLWLGTEVPSTPWLNSDASILLYGILINADANEKTGVDGIDYQLEIQWNNDTETWTKFLTEYSSEGHQKVLEIDENFKEENLFDPMSSNDQYALLSLDLDTITLEDKYEVLSYAEVIYGKPYSHMTIDLTGWTGIQSTSSYYISTSPNPLSLRKGTETMIGLQLRTTSGLIANVTEFSPSQNPNVVITFNPENRNISYYGSENLAPFDIKVSDKALIGEYTIPIIANISEKFVQPSRFLKLNYTDVLLPTLGYKIASANLTVKVLEPLSILEQFKNFWDVFGDPISLIGGAFAAGFSALVFDRMNKKRKGKSNQETLDKY